MGQLGCEGDGFIMIGRRGGDNAPKSQAFCQVMEGMQGQRAGFGRGGENKAGPLKNSVIGISKATEFPPCHGVCSHIPDAL